MITEEKIEELYQSEFSDTASYQEISDRLHEMNAPYLNDLRFHFCNELLYVLSMNFTTYEGVKDGSMSSFFALFCENASLLTSDQLFFQAVAASFRHQNSKCLKLIKQYLYAYVEKHPEQPIDEYALVDTLFEPFKEAFPGFWEEISHIIQELPHSPGMPELCQLFGKYYSSKTNEEAIDLELDYLQQWSDSTLIRELIGENYYSMNMWQNAVSYFESIEDRNVFFQNDFLYFMMAYCYGKLRDIQKEESYYRKAMSIFPDNIDTVNNLAHCLYKQRKLIEAKELFEKCLELDPKYSYAVNNYVRVLIALHRYRDAKSFISEGFPVSASLRKKVRDLPSTNQRLKKASVDEQATLLAMDEDQSTQPKPILSEKAQQFSSEKLLEDELTARIESGAEVFGMKLKLYRRKGLYGRQFIIPIGRLDLLCEDDDGNLYVVELKKDSGYDDAYLQTAQYLDWFEHSGFAPGKKIQGIICLNSPTPELIEKVHSDSRMKLFEYQISYREL